MNRKEITGDDDRHTEGFRNGFKSSCTIIKTELNRLLELNDPKPSKDVPEGCGKLLGDDTSFRCGLITPNLKGKIVRVLCPKCLKKSKSETEDEDE